jgi:hypothetical protein
MSRYTARIRQLEKRLGVAICLVCNNGRWPYVDIVWTDEDEPELDPAPPNVCDACGEPVCTVRVVWVGMNHMDGELPTSGVQPMTPRLAATILRAAEEDGALPD